MENKTVSMLKLLNLIFYKSIINLIIDNLYLEWILN